jgi:hypothetical protein
MTGSTLIGAAKHAARLSSIPLVPPNSHYRVKAPAFRRVRRATISPSWEQIGSQLGADCVRACLAFAVLDVGPKWVSPRLTFSQRENGKRDALSAVIRDHGVRYLVVDQLHGGDPTRVSGLGQRVFSNEAVPSSP